MDMVDHISISKVIGNVPERKFRFQSVFEKVSWHYNLLCKLKEVAESKKVSNYKVVKFDYRPWVDKTDDEDDGLFGDPDEKESREQRQKREAREAREKAMEEFREKNPDKYYARKLLKGVKLTDITVDLNLAKLFKQIAAYGSRRSHEDYDDFLNNWKYKYC